MGLPQTPIPLSGDAAAKNEKGQYSLLAADSVTGQTIRLVATAAGELKTDTTIVTASLEELVNLQKGFEGTPIQVFGSVSAVPVATPTTVVSYTVPAGKISYINQASGSGENVSVYIAQKNGSDILIRRSSAADLNADIGFQQQGSGLGLKLVAGDIFRIQVEQIGPGIADFEVFIGGIEFDEP